MKGRVVAVALSVLAIALAAIATACGGQPANSSPSPRPAASVSMLPGLSAADRKQDRAAYEEVSIRVVEVFLKDSASRASKEAMAVRIAAMPEVVAYHFVTKREALARFRRRFGEKIVANLPINPLPASFEILVRRSDEVMPVVRRFFRDPIVDNDPGTHDGVKWSLAAALAASPSP